MVPHDPFLAIYQDEYVLVSTGQAISATAAATGVALTPFLAL